MPTKTASSWILIFALVSYGRIDLRQLLKAVRPNGGASPSAVVSDATDCPIPSALPCQIGGS